MTMSNVNNKQEANKQARIGKRQAMLHLLKEEFGAESNFDAKNFKEEGKFSTYDKPKSERTSWN